MISRDYVSAKERITYPASFKWLEDAFYISGTIGMIVYILITILR